MALSSTGTASSGPSTPDEYGQAADPRDPRQMDLAQARQIEDATAPRERDDHSGRNECGQHGARMYLAEQNARLHDEEG
jgi:hypothetical protein